MIDDVLWRHVGTIMCNKVLNVNRVVKSCLKVMYKHVVNIIRSIPRAGLSCLVLFSKDVLLSMLHPFRYMENTAFKLFLQ